jgi:alkaline phosphatase D
MGLFVVRLDGALRRIGPCRSYLSLAACCLAWILAATALAADFRAAVHPRLSRTWLGPEYWANPLQDWRLAAGRIECLHTGPNRNVHLLTHRLARGAGEFEVTVRAGWIEGTGGSVGFRVGIRGPLDDYRNALLFGRGIDAGMGVDGTLFFDEPPQPSGPPRRGPVVLSLRGAAAESAYRLTLTATDADSGALLGTLTKDVPPQQVWGNVALVCNHTQRGAGARYWFADWTLRGAKVSHHPEDGFGPILFAMHTLSGGVMKMTAQMPPIAAEDSQFVRLQVRRGDQWIEVAQARIDPLSRTATFRMPDWEDRRDVPYRLAYALLQPDGTSRDHYYTGKVRRDPVDKQEIVVAGFTGHQDYLFPNALLAGNVAKIDPDVLVFTGDQIYENNAGYGIVRTPVETATLDYLRKWYVFGWGFRELMRDRVTLCLPDDHDVYQGNIWGEGGRGVASIAEHAQGGYAMPAPWVNAIQRMQTSHHPDPYDATPIQQGITVYYGPMTYGRISIAVIEDRKFKSGPEGKVNYWTGRPDHVKDPQFDPRSVDKPGLELLGPRQLKFLREWAADWRGADMKLVVSQTIFANVANYHGAEQEYLVADLDSNGWPQSGRRAALHEMRRGFAFHLAGDQHLASIVHHGIDTWRDAGFSFCVPSIAAGYPRAWHPERQGIEGRNRPEGAPPYLGDFLDGLGNHITVHAVGNPEPMQRNTPLERGHDKASGFGVVRLDKRSGKITMECWRLLVDVANPKAEDQFPGWPMTIDMQDNYARAAAAFLPVLEVSGMEHPVVQVIDQQDNDIVYTLRIRGTRFRPKVFREDGSYTIRVGDPDTNRWKTLRDVSPGSAERLEIAF